MHWDKKKQKKTLESACEVQINDAVEIPYDLFDCYSYF